MPIYEYRCSNCQAQKEFLQKVSDPPHTVCPECGQAALSKMVTAAGFQLKGTGWYVTDFRNGSTSASSQNKDGKAGDGEVGKDAKAEGGADSGKTDSAKTDSGAAAAPAAGTTSGTTSKPDAPAPAA